MSLQDGTQAVEQSGRLDFRGHSGRISLKMSHLLFDEAFNEKGHSGP